MNAMVPHRGAAAVGYICDLAPLEANAVMYLRLWYDGPESQVSVWNDFATILGPKQGRFALQSFEALCSACMRYARRPLIRHQVACKCLGADESCFANFIGYASEGEREDAMMIASTIVDPNFAPLLASLAQDFGIALKRMSLMQKTNSETKNKTLH